MQYQEFLPNPALSPYIHKFWYVEATPPYKLEKIFPLAKIHFIINLSSPYKLFLDNKFKNYTIFKSSFVSGIQKKYIIIENPEKIINIGVEFKPHGFKYFTTRNILAITNKVLPGEQLFNNDLVQLKLQIITAKSIDAKFKILESFLTDIKIRVEKDFEIVDKINTVISTNTEIKLSDLAKDIGYSQKHLISLFKKSTGVNIKAMLDIYKFQEVINKIQLKRPNSWTELALDTGYYDQPHFIKRFKDFTGFTPKQYVNIISKNESSPNFIALDNR